MSTQSYAPIRHRGFISSLEGLRAIASLGVLATHVAFQTSVDPASNIGAVLARFDFFVAVFFALSAFVLWRRRRATSGTVLPQTPSPHHARILGNGHCSPAVYSHRPLVSQPDDDPNLLARRPHDRPHPPLVPVRGSGVLPGDAAFAWVLDRFGRPVRILLIVGGAVLSLAWPWIPLVEHALDEGWANMQIWPPAYACWFAVGMIAAEIEGVRFPRVPSFVWVGLALVVAWIAGQEWFGPLGLVHPSPWEFNLRVLAGTLFAVFLVVPYALGTPSRLLDSSWMKTLGTWSYSIFLWHLPVLTIVFPLLGLPLFSGNFLLVFIVTVLLTIPVAAISYTFIEEPIMRWTRRAIQAGGR